MATTTKGKASSNGQAIKEDKIKAAGKNGAANGTPVTPVVEDKFESRMLRIDELYAMKEKHELLTDTYKELMQFSFKAQGSSSIMLTDETGLAFKTANLPLVQALFEFLKQKLVERKNDLSQQIIGFMV